MTAGLAASPLSLSRSNVPQRSRACLCAILFVVLMFTSVPRLYQIFNGEPTRAEPLWTAGDGR